MAQLVDHFLTGLTLGEGEHCPMRRKQEHRLTQLLAELLDTERKYVDDLETVRVVDQDVCINPPQSLPLSDLILGGQRSILLVHMEAIDAKARTLSKQLGE